MTDNKLLTIVIPYYNLRFFKNTLESLFRQTDKCFCVLIGNDNSREDPLPIIEYYKDKLNITYIKFEENLGGKNLTLHWARCLELVSTPFSLILGDDDMLSQNALQEINKAIKSNSKTGVFRLSMLRIDENDKLITELINYQDIKTSIEFIVKRSRHEVLSSLGEYVFSMEKFRKYGIKQFPKAFYSDNMMILQYSDFGEVINIPKAISIIRVSKYSISGDCNNDFDIKWAASEFYYQLVTCFSNNFNKKQIKNFLPYILYGYKHDLLPINLLKLIKILIKYDGFVVIIDRYIKKYIHDKHS